MKGCSKCKYSKQEERVEVTTYWGGKKERLITWLTCRHSPPIMVRGTYYGHASTASFPTVEPGCWCYQYYSKGEH